MTTALITLASKKRLTGGLTPFCSLYAELLDAVLDGVDEVIGGAEPRAAGVVRAFSLARIVFPDMEFHAVESECAGIFAGNLERAVDGHVGFGAFLGRGRLAANSARYVELPDIYGVKVLRNVSIKSPAGVRVSLELRGNRAFYRHCDSPKAGAVGVIPRRGLGVFGAIIFIRISKLRFIPFLDVRVRGHRIAHLIGQAA